MMAGNVASAGINEAGGPPEWLSLALDAAPLDVRPLLAQGVDPFATVMEAATTVEFGGSLVVDAPFNPSPLRRILAGRGFSSYGRKLNEGHWRVFFHLDGGTDWESGAEVDVGPEGAMSWREDDGLHIDVRKLAPPNPMLAILRLVENVGPDETVVVHHEREPHFLAPELAERGWRIARVSSEVVNVRLWLERMI
ncbi:conserved protein of unknown function(Domain of unknown function DUF2249,126-189) [Magnetospirillum sp. XM-1]|uniref:DUF2249 domain-containing protein n=1 Tax=Magnetospirillum sp. XM-1 TaxID=1663591 RepID=UPI00073DD450|nr:DUF2249 domain-containing protein [Magnetospirillum sp. XM-1]CUW38768.1 conserved protein of unknown function(Domain of unknown function DUF2249,126-189) [Magnetospirillum sp. XM-1]